MKKKLYIITLIGNPNQIYQNVEVYREECCSMKKAIELTIEKAKKVNYGSFHVTSMHKNIQIIEID